MYIHLFSFQLASLRGGGWCLHHRFWCFVLSSFFFKKKKALKKNVKFLKRAGFWLVSLDDWMLQSSQSPLKRAEVVVLNCCITVKRNVSICSSAMLREQFDSRPLTVYQPTNLLLLINFFILGWVVGSVCSQTAAAVDWLLSFSY